jgi:hypothetical protein
MGKLRDSLKNLETMIGSVVKTGADTVHELTGAATNVKQILGRVNGGYELMAMYLKQKALKDKQKVEDWAKDPIKAHLDSEVAGFIKDIEAARIEAVNAFKRWETVRDVKGKAIFGDLDRVDDAVEQIGKRIAEKRQKWLQSKDYKSKLNGYEETLKGLSSQSKTLRVDFRSEVEATQSSGPQQLAKMKMSVDTTIKQIFDQAAYGLKDELNKIERAQSSDELKKRLARFGNEIKQIRAWVDEADKMELAADTPAPVKVDPKPKLTSIVIRKGSQDIAKSASGTYDRATKLLSIAVAEWKIKGVDPLGYLQQKFTVAAVFEDKAEGNFNADMKISKIGADLKKIELKGV